LRGLTRACENLFNPAVLVLVLENQRNIEDESEHE